jgi:hypothetical protein
VGWNVGLEVGSNVRGELGRYVGRRGDVVGEVDGGVVWRRVIALEVSVQQGGSSSR